MLGLRRWTDREHRAGKPHNNHAIRSSFMPEPKNVLGESLETCSPELRAGFTRGGNCETALQAIGSHAVCNRADLQCHPVDLS